MIGGSLDRLGVRRGRLEVVARAEERVALLLELQHLLVLALAGLVDEHLLVEPGELVVVEGAGLIGVEVVHHDLGVPVEVLLGDLQADLPQDIVELADLQRTAVVLVELLERRFDLRVLRSGDGHGGC